MSIHGHCHDMEDQCGPGTCDQFGGGWEVDNCMLRDEWDNDELIKEFGFEAMEEHLDEDEYQHYYLQLFGDQKMNTIVNLNGKLKKFKNLVKAQKWAKKKTERLALKGKKFTCEVSSVALVVEPIALVEFKAPPPVTK